MRASNWLLIFSLNVAFYQAALANDKGRSVPVSCKPVPRIHFEKSAHSAHFDGFIQRFQQSCFVFFAKKGQHAKIELSDVNGSASLSIYQPGFVIHYGNTAIAGQYSTGWTKDRYPINTYDGTTLTIPPEQQETAVHAYAGLLPQTGDYLIVVQLANSGASEFGGDLSVR